MKIKQRKEMAVAIGGHGEPGRVHSGKHFEKLDVSYRITCNNGNQRTLINS